jgi:CHAT domain-containing protein
MIVVFDKFKAGGRAAGGSPPLPDADTLVKAWELKDQCYAAWSSEPQRAAVAAAALRALCAGDVDAHGDAIAREISALADWTEGIAHITRGQMADAVRSLDAAALAFRALGQRANAAQTQVPKIISLSMLGQYDAAIACAEQAQREFVDLGDAHGAAKVSGNLGGLQERRGNYAQAARHSREASVLFARVGDHERSVQADINLANALTAMGDFDEALRIYARARMRAGTHDYPVLETMVDECVASVQLPRGRYREALAGFESARGQFERLGMQQNTAFTEKQLADTYLELRLLPEALALFDQVLARLQALDVLPDEQAWTLSQRGRAQVLLARPEQAARSFELAAALFDEQSNGAGLATVTLARAELALEGGDPARATELATRAGEGFAAAGRADGHTRADVVRAYALLRAGSAEQAGALFNATLMNAQALQLLTLQVRCRVGQGLAAQALGDTAQARAAFNDAVELFEDQRRALPGDDLRSAFLGEHLEPYRELLRLALQAHSAAPSPARALEVLHQLERVRARSLGERIDGDAAPADEPKTRAMRERVNWLYRRVQRLEDEGESAAALSDELRRTERELLEGARRARLIAAPEDIVDVADATRFDAAALQAALGDEGALIEYGVLDDELFACVVTRQGVHLQRRVASWREVQDTLRAARFQIETLRHGAAPVRQHLSSLAARTQRRLEQLHALVWAPLAPALIDSRRVLIVPCGPLGLLPFAALHDGSGALAQRFELALVPSARLALRGLLRVPMPPRRAVALGESSRLPHAAYEARYVAALFAEGRALVGTQATLEALREHAPRAELIHLACHAQFRNDNPMFSALYLHDGALTVEAVETLKLLPGTVVLSACETGVAESGSGEERVGLVRAFLVAGAARVLASLWPVDDEVTGAFMASFYAALCAGEPPAKALRQAQTRQMATHPHPFYWAAFTLHGGW